ncbi:hypothetical protein Tco_0567325 [Tanacetum coccineum]
MQGVSKTDFENYVKANDVVLRNMQNQGQGFTKPDDKFKNGNSFLLHKFPIPLGTSSSGPTIPTSSSPKVVERRTEVTKDTIFPTNNKNTEDVHPLVVLVENQILVSEPVVAPVSAPMPNPEPQGRKGKLNFVKLKLQSSNDEPPEVELKDLPPHLEYAFLEDNNKLPVIIAKDLSVDEKAALINVLKSRKRSPSAWKLSDIKGINPEFCSHKILMEEDYEPAVQHQGRVNPKIHDVIKKEVEKLLDAGLIYPISDSPWVSPVHCVLRKLG